MGDQRDVVLVEQSKIQQMRLASALLYGRLTERRTVNNNMKRLVASVILTAVISAGCVAVSFIKQTIADQAAKDVVSSQSIEREQP